MAAPEVFPDEGRISFTITGLVISAKTDIPWVLPILTP
jgi:hypothetical protein